VILVGCRPGYIGFVCGGVGRCDGVEGVFVRLDCGRSLVLVNCLWGFVRLWDGGQLVGWGVCSMWCWVI